MQYVDIVSCTRYLPQVRGLPSQTVVASYHYCWVQLYYLLPSFMVQLEIILIGLQLLN